MDEDDLIVLVVVDDNEEEGDVSKVETQIKIEPPEVSEVNDIIETAEKHGTYIAVKEEPDWDYNEDEILQKVLQADAVDNEYILPNNNDTDYIEGNIQSVGEECNEDNRNGQKHRFTMLKPSEQRSFVAELRHEYEELRDDEELLVCTLEQVMRSVKPPPPPRDYYIMNGILFECIKCGFLSETIPMASRHYQEKHGERYLVCFACGVDFRSTTNLYKHEKRCIAPDARVVLKARAAFLGRKGRSRPFLGIKTYAPKPDKTRFPCQLCSAVFLSRCNLQSHENLHRGERPFRCASCPCAYTSLSALTRHKKKHMDVQFICEHCSRSFKIKAALVSHMDTHKPLRKHPCSECPRRFAQKAALQLHIDREHRQLPPPCACRICPKRYPRMSLLKAHMKRAHGLSIMTRKMFFKYLPTMTDMEIKQSKVVLKCEDKLDYRNTYNIQDAIQSMEHDNNDSQHEFGNEIDNDEQIDNETANEIGSNAIDDRIDSEKNSQNYEDVQFQGVNVTIDDFLQYVRKGNSDLGSNVIYIENGEIVQSMEMEKCEDNLILEVEAMVDNTVLLDSLQTDNR